MIQTCTHGMPTPRSCVECMDDGPVYPPNIQPAAPGIAKWTTAVYPARCRACLTAVVEGDRIGYDPEIGWLCQHCAGAA